MARFAVHAVVGLVLGVGCGFALVACGIGQAAPALTVAATAAVVAVLAGFFGDPFWRWLAGWFHA